MANEENLRTDQGSRAILHIGAHRTGTTLFQEFLFRRQNAAQQKGIRFIEINACRKQGFLDKVIYNRPCDNAIAQSHTWALRSNIQESLDAGMRVVLSEENILGTMEQCVRHRTLYPDVGGMLSRIGEAAELFDTVYISIRPQQDWWRSVFGFFAKSKSRNQWLSNAANYQPILYGRSWFDVVSDVRAALNPRITIVRDFDAFISNPKRQLIEVSKWNDLKYLPGIEVKVSNASAPLAGAKLESAWEHSPSEYTREKLNEEAEWARTQYEEDLTRIRKMLGSSGRIIRPRKAKK